MATKSNPHNLQVGQKLWFVERGRRYARRDGEVTVSKDGSRWAEIEKGRERIDLQTLCVDGGRYSSPGTCYLTREEHEREVALRAEWSVFRRDVEKRLDPHSGLTVAAIKQARAVLGL